MSQDEKIHWERILVEAVAIVASILLAFAIDAWWEYRGEREKEQEILQNLLIEFERNRAELDRTLITLIESHNAGKQLLMFVGKSFTNDDNTVIEQKFEDLYVGNWFDPSSGALEALISGDQLNLILNTKLRTRLAGWSGLVTDYKRDEGELLYLLRRDLGPMLDAIAPLPSVEEAAPGFFQSRYQEAFKDIQFMNLIGNISFWANASVEEASLLGGEIDQIITLIENEIE